MRYIVPYSSLTTHGNGLIIEVFESHLHSIIRSVLALVEVDEIWYRSTYRDVSEAIASGELESARHHYILTGYFENRFPRRILVDERWYLNAYPDVAEAVRLGAFASGQEHFERDGYAEGRLPCAGWKL